MSTDVDVRFGAEFSAAKQALNAFTGDIKSWAVGAAALGVGAFAAWGAVGVFRGVVSGIREVTGALWEMKDAAIEAEAVDKQLEIAVTNAGKGFAFTSEQLKQAATALQANSQYGDETIKTAERIFIQYKLNGEVFKSALKASTDLASATGKDLPQAAQMLSRALVNPERGMKLLEKQGVVLADSQKELVKQFLEAGDKAGAQKVILDEVASKYKDAAAKMAGSAGGGLNQIAELWGDIEEELGGVATTLIEAVNPVIKELLTNMRAWAQGFKESFIDQFDEWAPKLQEVMVMGAAYIKTFVEDAIGNIDKLKLAWYEFMNAIDEGVFGQDDDLARKLFGAHPGMSGAAKWRLEQLRDRVGNEGTFEDRLKGNRDLIAGALAGVGKRGATVDDILVDKNKNSREFAEGIGRSLGQWVSQGTNLFTQGVGAVARGGVNAGVAVGNELSQFPEDLAEIAKQIRASQEGSGRSFTSGFEDASSMFRRIQVGLASGEDIPKKQLSALEKLILKADEQREAQNVGNATLRQQLDAFKKGQTAVAG